MSTLLFKTIDGKSFEIEVNLHNSIDSYQESIAEKSNVLVVDQRLIHGGKQIETNKTFSDCGIEKNSTIHVIERLPSSRQRELDELQKQARSVKIPNCEEIYEIQKLDDLNKQGKMSAIKSAQEKVKQNILQIEIETMKLKLKNKVLERELARLTQKFIQV